MGTQPEIDLQPHYLHLVGTLTKLRWRHDSSITLARNYDQVLVGNSDADTQHPRIENPWFCQFGEKKACTRAACLQSVDSSAAGWCRVPEEVSQVCLGMMTTTIPMAQQLALQAHPPQPQLEMQQQLLLMGQPKEHQLTRLLARVV